MHPELSGHEVRTAAKVCEELDKLGIEYELMDDIHAVVGIIRSGKPGKTFALRGDMDALPITEASGVDFASQNPGVMHACGHDVHTSALLGAAKVLSENKDKFCGNVKLLFQPNEEDDGGALPMIERGCLENPKVDAAFAFHVSPNYPAGKISGKRGYTNACLDSVTVDVYGTACHGAHPEGGVDAVFIAGQLIGAIYGLRTRRFAATDPLVMTIGRINGGTANNIVCDHVSMGITLRTINRESRARYQEELRNLVEKVCEGYGGRGIVTVQPGYENLFSDDRLYDRMEALSAELLGPDALITEEFPSMGGEDFGYFGRCGAALMYNLGTGSQEGHDYAPLHSSTFTVDESAFYYGILLNCAMTIDFLKM